MTSEMAFECLLVSRDQNVVCTMNRLLGNLSINIKLCLSSSKALDQLSDSTDLIVLDWDEDAANLLDSVHKTRKWKRPTVVAISEEDRAVRGADIALRKPVTSASGGKSLRVAYSRMLYDYRRQVRYALTSPVQATDQNQRSVEMRITDIGRGGVGLSSKEEFVAGDLLSFHVLLPGAVRPIYVEARVLWTRSYGAVGCEYVRIPPVDLDILHEWLKNKSQVKKPLVELTKMD